MKRIALALALVAGAVTGVVTGGVTGVEAACRTVTLPESNNTGGAVTMQPGSNYMVYYPPAGATSVGLEFWSHAFLFQPAYTQYLLVYLNDPTHGGRRIFHAWNAGPEYDTGWPSNFPMSIFVNPGEYLVVNWLNNTDAAVDGYLIVTIRECL